MKRLRKRTILCNLAAVAWLAAASVSAAQDASARTIAAIEVTGLTQTTRVFVDDLIGVRPGQPYDAAVLDQAVTRLLRTGRFLTATYTTESEAEGIRVIFDLRERTVVTSVRFQGNARFRGSQLEDVVDVKVGQPIDWFAVRDGRDAVVNKYQEEGFGDVGVNFDRDLLQETGELVYTIEEGPRVRIREILFEGNTTFEAKELKRKIETKAKFWFIRAGTFEQDQVDADIARLQNFYRDVGFLDARVSYRREASEEPGDLRLVFVIVEGTRYAIEDIQFVGNTVFPTEELRELIGSRVDATVNRPQIDNDVSTIRSRYWELGYIDVLVRAVRVFSDSPGLVRLTFEIEEGGQFRVGRIVVRGNTRTKDKVVRRELNLYPPDDLLDLNEAREAEKRLLQTQIFGSARVLPVGDEPDVRDIVVDVTEAEKSGDFIFGVGVTSNSGLVGTISLDLRNFDIFDPPRTLAELYKFRSFYGAGQHVRIEGQPGTEVSRFRIDFTEPYLFDKPIRFDTGFYLFQRERDDYDEQRVGFNISIGKRFERGRLRGWSGELALRLESINIDDIDVFASDELREDEGSSFLTSLKASLVRDRTDNRFLPTTGDRLSVSYEQTGFLGGDYTFGKVRTGYTWFKTLREDALNRKSVLALNADGGAIVGDAPVVERFFAGGTGSIRGFEFRGIGERDGIADTNIGGDYLLLLGAEYSFPLIGENVRGHVFLDTGTAGAGQYRAAIGAGIRLTLDVFGPLPIELNLAAPISRDADDDEQVFSFSIGRIF